MRLQIHLTKSGSGMTAKSACGRNILQTPLSTSWDKFKALPEDQKCCKCSASKQASLNVRFDSK